MKEITLDPAEVRELLELMDRHNKHFLDDLLTAESISEIAAETGLCKPSPSWTGNTYATMGLIFRAGYIMGQRSARGNRSGNPKRTQSRPPIITRQVTKADIMPLVKRYGYYFPGNMGVTDKTLAALFGEKIAKGALRYVTACGYKGSYWDTFSACAHTTVFLTIKGFEMAALGYCNHYIGKGVQT